MLIFCMCEFTAEDFKLAHDDISFEITHLFFNKKSQKFPTLEQKDH